MTDVLDQLTDAQLLEMDGEIWAQHYFPQSFTRPFTRYQTAFWDWGWEIEPDKYYTPRVECEPRGVGKSTTGQTWIVSLLARYRRKTIGYVSREDDKATQHFNSIKRKLENHRLLQVYPHLRPRIQTYRNSFSSWSQERLVTDAGQMIVPITLLGSKRGYKSEDDVRFDLIILDDIDKLGESSDVREKNLELLKSEVLAAGYSHTLVVFLQNLIHRDSICAMVMDHRADILSERKFCGPFPLMKWYDAEKVDLEDGAKRWVITAGEPYDKALDIPYCESLLNQFGKDTFDRECQQDVNKVAEDKDFREWDEIFHITTWAEMARGFAPYHVQISDGSDYFIPNRWNVGMGFDWGTTRQHPSAIAVVTRPDQTTPLDDSHFVIGEVVLPVFPFDLLASSELVSPGRVAAAVKKHLTSLRVQESKITDAMMSHEASAAQNTLIEDLPEHLQMFFTKWKAAKGSGVPQIQNLLEIDRKKPHPFRRYPDYCPLCPDCPNKELHGKPLMGRPRIYFVVADGQGELFYDMDGKLRVRGATDNRGLARARFEIPLYSFRSTGKKKIDDDFVDGLRGLMATFGVIADPQSKEEKLIERLPDELKPEAVRAKLGTPEFTDAYWASEHAKKLAREQEKKEDEDLARKWSQIAPRAVRHR